MTPSGDERSDREYVDSVIREVCDDFNTALEASAEGSISRRYAAVPSWWCIDGRTARHLLSRMRETDSGSAR